jgi:hypothetical protein
VGPSGGAVIRGIGLLAAATLAFTSFLVGRATASTPTVQAAVPTLPQVVCSTEAPIDVVRLKKDIEGIVRAELTAQLANHVPEASAPTDPPPKMKREPTSIEVIAHTTGTQLIEQAQLRKHWSDTDRDALRAQLALMREDEADALMHRLLASINRGEMEVTLRGMPF